MKPFKILPAMLVIIASAMSPATGQNKFSGPFTVGSGVTSSNTKVWTGTLNGAVSDSAIKLIFNGEFGEYAPYGELLCTWIGIDSIYTPSVRYKILNDSIATGGLAYGDSLNGWIALWTSAGDSSVKWPSTSTSATKINVRIRYDFRADAPYGVQLKITHGVAHDSLAYRVRATGTKALRAAAPALW